MTEDIQKNTPTLDGLHSLAWATLKLKVCSSVQEKYHFRRGETAIFKQCEKYVQSAFEKR